MADGGEGTVQSLVDATNGNMVYTKVFDPLMREIETFYGILGDSSTSIIEMSAASGLPLISKLSISILDVTGAGAAGGLGGGLMAFLKVKLKRGIDIVIDAAELENIVKGAVLVITGKGSIDYQTQFRKTPYGVAIAGSIGKDANALCEKGFHSVFLIVDKPMTLEEDIENGESLLENTAERIMRAILCMKVEKS